MERKEIGNINTKLKNLTLKVLAGVSLMSPMVGRANENISGDILNNNVDVIDTVKGIETSSALSKEEEKLVDMRFKSFLDGEGNYSDDNIINNSLYNLGNYKRDLGYCGLNVYSVILQGVLMGHVEFNNRDYVLIGIKNHESERKITLVEWQIDKEIEAKSWVGAAEMVGGGSSTRYISEFLNSREAAVSLLRDNTGDMVLFNLYKIDKTQVGDETFKSLDEKSYNYFLNEVVPKTGNTINFVSGLLVPPKKELTDEDNKYVKSLKKTDDIPNFESYSGVVEFLKTNTEIPILASITHRK